MAEILLLSIMVYINSVFTNLKYENLLQVKVELCIKFNFSMTCREFYNHTSKDRKLIECAKSEKKYDFFK